MKRSLAVLVLATAGCTSSRSGTTGPIVGVPRDVPDRFEVALSGLNQSEKPKPGDACRNPMVDPRDRTILTLRRSAGGKGDYAVEDQKYGVTSKELLRIDCSTGQAVGIVRE